MSEGFPSIYYNEGAERDRLETGVGRLEYARSQEIISRHLPLPGAAIADIGGGPGRYSLWLAGLGYRVVLRDLVPLHVEQTREAASSRGLTIDAAVADARSLDLDDGSVDAVLLLGPLYHLTSRPDRIRTMREAYRVVRDQGLVFIAAISRWAPLFDGVVRLRLYREYPHMLDLEGEVERTGIFKELFPGSFSGYCHRPDELKIEAEDAGFEVLDLVSVEGIGASMADLDDRWEDQMDREVLLSAARRTERVPELIGLGPHLMLTARKNQG